MWDKFSRLPVAQLLGLYMCLIPYAKEYRNRVISLYKMHTYTQTAQGCLAQVVVVCAHDYFLHYDSHRAHLVIKTVDIQGCFSPFSCWTIARTRESLRNELWLKILNLDCCSDSQKGIPHCCMSKGMVEFIWFLLAFSLLQNPWISVPKAFPL